MKYFPTREFNKKLSALSDFERIQAGNVVRYLQDSDKEVILQNATLLDLDVYFIGSKEARVYFTMGSDDTGDYLLLLDMTVESRTPLHKQKKFFALRDPKRNMSLNPTFNHSINPTFNHSINPTFNHSINPTFNHSINPTFNHSINPTFNHSINPTFNHSINPTFNHSINPTFNHSINPIYNRSFGGPFVYSKDLIQEGYMVQANEQVHLFFDMSTTFKGIGVEHSSGVIVIFDTHNKNIGYLVPAPNEVYLRYGEGTNWNGIVV